MRPCLERRRLGPLAGGDGVDAVLRTRTEDSGLRSDRRPELPAGDVVRKISISEILPSLAEGLCDRVSIRQLQQLEEGDVPEPSRSREAAYLRSKTRIQAWEPLVQTLRRRPHVVFPLREEGPRAPSVTESALREITAPSEPGAVPTTTTLASMMGTAAAAAEPQKVVVAAAAAEDPLCDDDAEAEDLLADAIAKARWRSACFFRGKKDYHASRIKSKTYRRIRRLERERNVPTLEELAEVDPEAYGLQLQRLERLRVKERTLQQHGHRTAWAKYALRSKNPALQKAAHDHLKMKQALLKKEVAAGSAAEAVGSDDGGDDDEGKKRDAPEETVPGEMAPATYTSIMNLPFMKAASSVEDGNEHRGDTASGTTAVHGRGTRLQFTCDTAATALPAGLDLTEDPATKAMIAEAFESDDDPLGVETEAGIRAEKVAEVDALLGEREDYDCATTAGWNDWIGPWTKPSRRRTQELREAEDRRQRDRKAALAARADASTPHVLINEDLPKCSAKYRALEIPAQYRGDVERYEAAAMKPIGPEWNAYRSYINSTRPKIIVEAGTVIRPIAMATDDVEALRGSGALSRQM